MSDLPALRMIVDGNNLAVRCWHVANRAGLSHHGEETGSLHLFIRSLAAQVRRWGPSHLAVCWDTRGRDNFRYALYEHYKANRTSYVSAERESEDELFGLIKTFLALNAIPQLSHPEWEADDLIASVWRQDPQTPVVILSNDKDLLQLLDERTTVVRWSSFNTPTDDWDRRRFRAERGFLPEQLPKLMALTGDTSDGIPGVRGIGPVKAKKLLDSLDWQMSALTFDPEQHKAWRIAYELVDLIGSSPLHQICPAPESSLPPFEPVGPGHQMWYELAEFCAHYGLRTTLHSLTTNTLWATNPLIESNETVAQVSVTNV